MMQFSQKSEASTWESLNGELEKDSDRFITIPLTNDLQKSLEVMTEQQIHFNIIQLNLTALYNSRILDHLYRRSTDTKFYLMNRYLLQNIMSVTMQGSPSRNSKADKKQKKHMIADICAKYDALYVNGLTKPIKKEQKLIKQALFKETRATFISEREQFINYLEELSQLLKIKADQYEEDELRHYFESKIDTLNKCQLHNTLSEKKLEVLRSSTDSFGSSNQEALSEVSSVDESPQKLVNNKQTIFSMYFNGQVYSVKEINIETSGFVKTKNRFPLILDFDFSRFLYKFDNQLGHQLIAMHLLRYLNRIISLKMKNQQIIEYQIIPENKGAFYEFVENSKTISKVKMEFGSIKNYLDYLQNKYHGSSSMKNLSPVRKRFAQTFAGFSTAQYFLEIKDRNNDNIMIRNDGSIFHIDLAFIFKSSPGGVNFQSVPFKFTKEYLQAMGDFESDTFIYYESLMISNLTRLFINKQQLMTKMGILSAREEIPCFRKFRLSDYEKKFPKKIEKVTEKVQDMIAESYDNWRTTNYDEYQFKTNGILP